MVKTHGDKSRLSFPPYLYSKTVSKFHIKTRKIGSRVPKLPKLRVVLPQARFYLASDAWGLTVQHGRRWSMIAINTAYEYLWVLTSGTISQPAGELDAYRSLCAVLAYYSPRVVLLCVPVPCRCTKINKIENTNGSKEQLPVRFMSENAETPRGCLLSS